MQIITLTQPWATLVAIRAKIYETRSWGTTYRGPVGIHAGKNFPREYMELCREEPFATVLAEAGYNTLQKLVDVTGHVLCVVDLVYVLPTHGYGETMFGAAGAAATDLPDPAPHEEDFGNYAPGRKAWATARLRRLATPVPAIGAQGLRSMRIDVYDAVLAQLEAQRG